MIDAKSLLDRFLGSSPANAPAQPASPWTRPGQGSGGGLADTARDLLNRSGGLGGFAGGAAAGGVLGMLLGGKRGKRSGGLLSHGGAAVLGALAHRAWQNWQAGQAPGATPPTSDERFLPGAAPAATGEPFELSLIRAMIGAARADGHIDATEQGRIFAHVEKAGLDAEAKAFVFDTLNAPIGVSEVAAAAGTPEQAAELYLISRLTLDVDQPAERAYLSALAHRLKLPPELVTELDREVLLSVEAPKG